MYKLDSWAKRVLQFIVRTRLGSRVAAFTGRVQKTTSREITHGDTTLTLAYSFPAVRRRVDTFSSKEPETLAWIDTFAPGSKFVDVGANIGLYSVYAASRGSEVLAIEPAPENIFTLILNCQLNQLSDSIDLYFGPIGRLDGESVRVQQATIDPGGALLSALGEQQNALIEWKSSIRSLDSLCSEREFLPEFIKVDIDGNELDLVLGATKIFARAEQILLETDVEAEDFLTLLAHLESLGFQVVRKDPTDPGSSVMNLLFERQARAAS